MSDGPRTLENPIDNNHGVFVRTEEQLLFEATTKRFLEAECPLDRLRDLATLAEGFELSFWERGAELGWTSLLVPIESGGGSVSDQGVMDLALVAYQFGLHAAPGPLLGSNVVAAAIGRWGSPSHRAEPLQQLLNGHAIGAWALAEPPPAATLGRIELRATEVDDGFLLEGVKSPVEGGLGAGYILVTARTGSGLSQFLLRGDTEGLRITPLHSLDMTKRFARLEFDEVHVPRAALVGEAGAGGHGGGLAHRLGGHRTGRRDVSGPCGGHSTPRWSGRVNRYSFGRPLASYQEVKHRFADMKMWLEASHTHRRRWPRTQSIATCRTGRSS